MNATKIPTGGTMTRTVAYWWDGVRVETQGEYTEMEALLSNLRCMGVRAVWVLA